MTIPDSMTITAHCEPGTATPERAAQFANQVVELLNAIAEDQGGGVTFHMHEMKWSDDGVDDITVRVSGVTITARDT
jgi:hypothetical protein